MIHTETICDLCPILDWPVLVQRLNELVEKRTKKGRVLKIQMYSEKHIGAEYFGFMVTSHED